MCIQQNLDLKTEQEMAQTPEIQLELTRYQSSSQTRDREEYANVS